MHAGKRPRFLNAQPHIQGKSKCCSSSWSSHWPCWRNLEATTTCVYLPSFSWPGNLSPYPTGHHPVYALRVQVTKHTQMAATQLPSHQMACRKSGRERVTTTFHNLWHHCAHSKQQGCLTALGAVANCTELPFLTGRRQGVTFTCRHSAHMQQNPRSHRALHLQYKHKSAIQCRVRWSDHQVTGRSSLVVYRNPSSKRSVPSQNALVLPWGNYSRAWCFGLCSRQ